MKLSSIIVAAAIGMSSSFAQAQAMEPSQGYGGLTISNSGQARGISRTGERVSDDGRLGYKLFGGWNLNEYVAVEGGYASYGNYTLKNTGPGTTGGDTTIGVNMAYVAARGTWRLSDNFGVFAKVGIAHSRFDFDGSATSDVKMTRPMFGIGAQYSLTKNLALTVELNHYGKKDTSPTTRFDVRKLEVGLKYDF